MYIYFVGEANPAYYMSPMFGRILQYLNLNPRRVNIRQGEKRQSFAIRNVPTIDEAVSILEYILTLPSA